VCPYSLDREELIISQLWSFQGAREPSSPNENAGLMSPQGTSTGLSKLNSERLQPGEQALSVEVDVDLGEPGLGRLKCV
jgi:hypothetical protein